MTELLSADFAGVIAGRIEAEHISISERWLGRLHAMLSVDVNEVFPTEHLLDHIPALVRELADYVRAPESEAVAANTAVMAKARELGQLRHAQRASVHQLLGEYRLLDGILTNFVQEEVERLGMSSRAVEAVEVLRRLNEGIWILTQTTIDTFVAEYTATISSHAARLESFNRMVSHELRQPLGTLMYAVPLLKAESPRGDGARQEHLFAVLDRNIARLTQLIAQLEALSRLQARNPDTPDVQQTEIASVAWEVTRQIREMAEARGVEIFIKEPLPALVIDAARLELILMNLISNGVKYCDPDKAERFVVVESVAANDPSSLVIAVRDNGLGIPAASLETVFRRFVRAHAGRDSELGVRGSGLGLAIAMECAEAIGGTLRVESAVGVGSSFFVSIPREPSARAHENNGQAGPEES